MRRRFASPMLVFIAVLFLPSLAYAQRSSWGASVFFVPSWKTVDQTKGLFDADAVNVEGKELRVGLVRGSNDGGDWGISFVSKTVDSGSTVVRGSQTFTASSDVSMKGAVLHAAPALHKFGRRAQLNLILSGGAAKVSGVFTRPGGTEEAKRTLAPFHADMPVEPLAGLELGVTVVAAPGFKFRASGGFAFPGVFKIGVGAVVLFQR